jgi:hypothetical protein
LVFVSLSVSIFWLAGPELASSIPAINVGGNSGGLMMSRELPIASRAV